MSTSSGLPLLNLRMLAKVNSSEAPPDIVRDSVASDEKDIFAKLVLERV